MQFPALCCGPPLVLPRAEAQRPARGADLPRSLRQLRAEEGEPSLGAEAVPGQLRAGLPAPLLASDSPGTEGRSQRRSLLCPLRRTPCCCLGRGWSGAGRRPGWDAAGAEPAGAGSRRLKAPGRLPPQLLPQISLRFFHRFLEQMEKLKTGGTGAQAFPESPGRRSAATPPGCPHARHGTGVRGNKLCPGLRGLQHPGQTPMARTLPAARTEQGGPEKEGAEIMCHDHREKQTCLG
ncbi:collagen alpha-1(I) chain-like [Passer montanus]|uniref:collagen alpha-1(I) chain-like n=1 Tax=Passer montanus TaxID=9160 RepID=UPI00195FF7D9|nr:collagen alpha-1(I) chain-like [Passer montanus]